MPSAGVVADANTLLSAVIGKAAARIFREFALPGEGRLGACRSTSEHPILTLPAPGT